MRLVPFLALAALIAGPALAQDSVDHSAAASDDASGLVEDLGPSGVQAVAGSVALPVAAGGGVSQAAGASAMVGGFLVGAVGIGLVDSAGAALEQTWGPLKIDDKVVTAPDPAPLRATR